MATKKNNTKKADNKPETKEEIVEIKEKEIIEELVELADEDMANIAKEHDEEIVNFLVNKGLDDQAIKNVLNNEELDEFVSKLMEAEKKPSLKERAKKFASDKKEAIQNTAIVVGATAAICGVVYAVCNVADDDDEHKEDDIIWVYESDQPDDEGRHHIDVVDEDGKEYDLITQVVPKEVDEAEEA